MHSKQKVPQGMRESTPVERARTSHQVRPSQKQESTVLYVWNAKGDDFGTMHFGVMSDGGYVPVVTVDQTELSVALSDGVADYYDKPMLRAFEPQTLEVALDIVDADFTGLLGEIGRSREPSEMTVSLEQSYSVFEYRHKFVWQYNRERKGNKANRRKRGRWCRGTMRTVLPDMVVTDVRQPLSDQAFAPVEVTFGRRATA